MGPIAYLDAVGKIKVCCPLAHVLSVQQLVMSLHACCYGCQSNSHSPFQNQNTDSCVMWQRCRFWVDGIV